MVDGARSTSSSEPIRRGENLKASLLANAHSEEKEEDMKLGSKKSSLYERVSEEANDDELAGMDDIEAREDAIHQLLPAMPATSHTSLCFARNSGTISLERIYYSRQLLQGSFQGYVIRRDVRELSASRIWEPTSRPILSPSCGSTKYPNAPASSSHRSLRYAPSQSRLRYAT